MGKAMGQPENNPDMQFFASHKRWVRDRSKKEIAVLMSGGVDSSVAALLLRQAGWKVLGVTMKIPSYSSSSKTACCGPYANLVCRGLDIPHYVIDVRKQFESVVVDPFRRHYLAGLTPNPCLLCNTVLKFELVWDLVEAEFGIEYLATGHYARVEFQSGNARLTRAGNLARDQSYFLYGVPRKRLPHLLFPVGDLAKSKVREIARGNDLLASDKPDSMEICFTGEGDYRKAIFNDNASLSDSPNGLPNCAPDGRPNNSPNGARGGPIFDSQGSKIGEHAGIFNYTIGQRRGLGVSVGRPLYVTKISRKNNSVTLGTYEEATGHSVTAMNLNVLVPEKLVAETVLYGKIRSSGEPAECRVLKTDNRTVVVDFAEPQFAPTPGQHLVLYDRSGYVIAGGQIVRE